MNIKLKTLLCILTFFFAFLYTTPLWAPPEIIGDHDGKITVNTSGNTTNFIIDSQRAAANISSLSSSSSQTFNFIYNVPNGSFLARDVSGSATMFNGALNTFGINPLLVIVNTRGIVFGETARINLAENACGSIIASTLNISNNDFMNPVNGAYKFYRDGDSSFIYNAGRIAASPGGYVILLSQAINNSGTIQVSSINANVGKVMLAVGERMTVSLDDKSQVSVAVDESLKDTLKIIGPDGNPIDSAIKNSGTILAEGGKVVLTAKVLNKIFDYAVNNTGIIQATNLVNNNGVVELVAEGPSPILNAGTIEAGSIRVSVTGSDFINRGSLCAKILSGSPIGGDIDIKASNLLLELGKKILADRLVTIDVDTVVEVIFDTNGKAVAASEADIVNAGEIMSAPTVNITMRKLGSSTSPVYIKAGSLYIKRIDGNIDILESVGIGTSVLMRGPPEGGFAIIYNIHTNLTLVASAGFIYIGKGVNLTANNLTLESRNGIYSTGSITTPNTLTLISGGDIYSLGALESSSLIERGNTFKIGGIFHPGYADVKNADNAIEYVADSHVSAVITDPANIIVDTGVTLTMDADTAFNAGGAFIMAPTSAINGCGYNLSISAGSSSTLGNINNINLLTLSSSSGSNVTFTSNSTSTFQVNTVKTNYHAILSRSVGTGTSSNPIMIYSVSNAPGGLQYIQTSSFGRYYYKLANNIDASETSSWNSGQGFMPISPFIGTFNGNSKTVSNLYINRPSQDDVGLFGYSVSSSSIFNLGLIGTNTSITGGGYVGGLVGLNYGSISNSYFTGNVNGNGYVGGLVGLNYSPISNLYSTGSVSGGDFVGGLVGLNYSPISNSYFTGNVNGNGYVGGLVGLNYGAISNSYSTGSVTGGYFVGGLVGLNYDPISNSYSTVSVSGGGYVGGLIGLNYGAISNSYSTGSATGGGFVGGLIGLNYSSITNSYSTGNASGDYVGGLIGLNYGPISNSYSTGSATGGFFVGGLVGLNYSTIGNSYCTGSVINGFFTGGLVGLNYGSISNSYFTDGSYDNGYGTLETVGATAFYSSTHSVYNTWDISNSSGHAWIMAGYPHLQIEWTPTITNVYQLQMMLLNPSTSYTLANNIDASETNNWNYNGSMYNGFSPILNFAGTLEGNNYTISNLYINRPYNGNIGLFANTTAGSIGDLILSGANISGLEWVGALAGVSHSTITNCSVTGTVNGLGAFASGFWGAIGGLVGENYGSINSCNTSVTVTSNSKNTGGLVGYNTGAIANSYATGNVISTDDTVGGLVGYNYTGSITNSYATGSVNGNYAVGGLVGWNDTGTLPNAGSITNSYATGNVTSGYGYYNIGGLVGYNTGYISGSHATGNVNGWCTVGGLVGNNGGDTTEHNPPVGSIDNCYYIGNVTGYNSVGGLVGWNDLVPITNSYATANVIGSIYVGGLVGYNSGSIASSHSIGSVIGNGDGIGGLVGINLGAITNSYNASTVTSGGPWGTGGLVGENAHGGSITNSYNTGSVSGVKGVGGLTGNNEHVIDNCYNTGGVTGSGWDIGGLVGYNDNYFEIPQITNSHNTGIVTSTGTGTPNGFVDIGGLVGENAGSIATCYNTGNVNGSGMCIGGLVGLNDDSGSISNSYSNSTVFGSANSAIIGGLVGGNMGSITTSYSSGTVSTNGNNNDSGGLVGGNTGIITNSYSNSIVSAGNNSYDVGGLAGYNGPYNGVSNGASITNCYSIGNVSGGGQVGGLVGSNEGSITNSYSTGSVSGGSGDNNNIGGLVGRNIGSISNSYSTGNVYVPGNHSCYGGLVGDNYDVGSISNSYSTGNVIVGDNSCSVGGLVGYNNNSITNSYSTGNVSVGNNCSATGGLVGCNDDLGSVTNSYSTGNVSAGNNSSSIGGLVGYNNGSIINSYSIGQVSAGTNSSTPGGFVGCNDVNGTITNCGWWTGAAAQAIGFGSGTVTYNESSTAAFYSPAHGVYNIGGSNQWDIFTPIWDTYTDQFPHLHFENHSGNIYSVWSGTTSTDWSTPSNWVAGTIPGATANIFISARLNNPIANSDITCRNFYLLSGTFISNSTYAFSVAQSFSIADGAIFNRFTGMGTNADPYIIYDVYGLQGMKCYLSSSFRLNDNIDASGTVNWNGGQGFVPVGTKHNSFLGSFDGNFKTISSLYINLPLFGDGVGLFGRAGTGSCISNVGLINVNITGGIDATGALVGYNNGSISNSYSTGVVSSLACDHLGGLVGYNKTGATINNSYSTANVIGEGFAIGGLVGYNSGLITNSYSTGNVSGEYGGDGGFVGSSAGTIINSYSTGNVTVSGTGIYNGQLYYAYAIGGFAGANAGTITNSYSTGTVNVSRNDGFGIGGFIGENGGFSDTTSNVSIINSYSTGNITISGTGNSGIGGFVGDNITSNGFSTSITNSYSTGNVSAGGGSQCIGGLVGCNTGSIINCAWVVNPNIPVIGYDVYTNGPINTFVGSTNPNVTGTDASNPSDFYNPAFAIYNIGGSNQWDIFAPIWDTYTDQFPHLHFENHSGNIYSVWSGTTSTDWSTPSNWVAGTVPGATANIFISARLNNPIASSNITSSNILIGSGAVLDPGTFTITGTDLDVYGTLLVKAITFAGNYAFSGTKTLRTGSTVNYALNGAQTIDNTLPYYNLFTSGSGTKTLNDATTVNGNLTIGSGTTLDVSTNNYGLTVGGNWTNNGIFSPRSGTVIFNGTSPQTINAGSSIFYNLTIRQNAVIYTDSGSLPASGAFNMDLTSTIDGRGLDLSISAGSASTLGNINNVNLLTLSSFSGSNVTFTSNSNSTFQATTVKTNYHAILSRSKGAGTSSDPIMIYSVSNAPGGLQYIPTSGLGLYYKLANNIDASETSSWNAGAGFVPIGDNSNQFTGTFNGNSNTISGLYINLPSTFYVGLFGCTGTTANISNIGVVNISVTGIQEVGGLVGMNNGIITCSYSTGNVTAGAHSYYVGGLVGNNTGPIQNSYSTVTVTAGDGSDAIGGLAGSSGPGPSDSIQSWYFCIQNCYSTGNVISNHSWFIGGLVGTNNLGPIQNSYFTGTVTAGDNSCYIGGLVGDNFGGSIQNSYSTGTVTAGKKGGYVGGLSGSNDGPNSSTGSIQNSYSTGTVITGDASCYVGGLVGENYGGSIQNSYSTGTITAGDNNSDIGGLVGYNYGSIQNSYSTETITAGKNVISIGGLVGENDYTSGYAGYITNCAWVVNPNINAIGYDSYTKSPIGTFAGSIDPFVTGADASSASAFYNPAYPVYAQGTPGGWNFNVCWIAHSDSLPTLGINPNDYIWIATSAGSWSTNGNWSRPGCPGPIDIVVFNYTSIADSIIDNFSFAGTIAGLYILPGYTGTITQNAPLTITGNYVQESGKFICTNPITNTFKVGGSFTVPAYDAGVSYFNRYTVDNFNNYFIIRDGYDLQMMQEFLSGNFELANNIYGNNLNGNNTGSFANWNAAAGFVPVGNSSNLFFKGNFNGNGYTINNLYINNPTLTYTGLFGYIGATANISNIGMVNISVTGQNDVGGLVGWNLGLVANSYSTGNITAGNNNCIGGLVGFNDSGSIVANSYSTVNVTAGNSSNYIGGLVGENYNYGTIQNSYSTGTVTTSGNSTVFGAYIGGLVGQNFGSIQNSYSTGNVIAGDYSRYIGGLVGGNNPSGTIKNSYCTGNVDAGYCAYIGGLVGSNGGTIQDSYSAGNVTAEYTAGHNSSSIGGLVGSNGGTIQNSYSAGNVYANTSANSVGPLLGSNSHIFNNCWYSGTATNYGNGGVNTIGMGQEVAVTNLQDQHFIVYTGYLPYWDFTNIWFMPGDGFPKLRSL